MRRIAVLLGLTVLFVTVAAGIAVPAVKVADLNDRQCNNNL